jgi:hypothetical protein
MSSGTVAFQANDKTDVFHLTRIQEAEVETSDETLIQVEDTQFDSDKAWVTGNVPAIKPVHVEGDTSIIMAWFKGEVFDSPFVITVYVECETAEELEGVVAHEDDPEKDHNSDFLEPMEINL